jgi:hypothetical protein
MRKETLEIGVEIDSAKLEEACRILRETAKLDEACSVLQDIGNLEKPITGAAVTLNITTGESVHITVNHIYNLSRKGCQDEG